MENLIVWLIVAGAFGFIIKGFVKTYKGEGGCTGNCSGCTGKGPGNACDPDNIFLNK
ncbi:MAG: FeoB-associated Cys-rich membrane protein [Desulfobacter sp.]|nr:FeoB-associated Cys-rich membrane protein [Desulfobacter sp.]WDP85793.1 MAG: FeoB-associated Cys-rich membrane protein [Desulfobacter sp.]